MLIFVYLFVLIVLNKAFHSVVLLNFYLTKFLNENIKILIYYAIFSKFRSCDKFLMDLSLATGGRYHCCQGDSDAQLAIHKINSIMTSQDHDENVGIK